MKFCEKYTDNGYIISDDCRKLIVLRDKGTSTYIGENDNDKRIIVYQIDNDGNIYESKISKIIYETNGIAFDKSAIGKSVFLEKNKIKKNYC